ncbi:MAG: hypothetical protein QM598_07440 [Protaetiibacter sp.]
MSRRTAAALAVPLTLLFALSGCALLGGDPESRPADGTEEVTDDGSDALGPALTDCVDGSWTADLEDLTAQLAASLTSSGMTITGSSGTGTMSLTIDGAGSVDFLNDAVLQIDADLGGGLAMTVTQHHVGSAVGQWAWDGSAAADDASGHMLFSGMDNSSYTVDNTITVNGESSDAPIPIPSDAITSGMAVGCTGDTLTTKPDGGPFTTTWYRD